MTTLTNVEIFERVIEAFNRDGLEGVLPYYTDDAEVYDPDLPPGSYRGLDAVSRVIEMLISGFEDVEIRDFRLLPAGDRVPEADAMVPGGGGDHFAAGRDGHGGDALLVADQRVELFARAGVPQANRML